MRTQVIIIARSAKLFRDIKKNKSGLGHTHIPASVEALQNEMFDRKKDFKCKECGMQFNDPVRLERHFKTAHRPKHDGFRPKWYWEN